MTYVFKLSHLARDEDYIIRRNEQDPCPIVVAPFNAGGNLNWGPLANFGTFFRGYSKQTGPFDTSFGGNGNLMQGGGLGIGGWNQIVPNRSTDKDCHNNQQQQTPINPNFGG